MKSSPGNRSSRRTSSMKKATSNATVQKLTSENAQKLHGNHTCDKCVRGDTMSVDSDFDLDEEIETCLKQLEEIPIDFIEDNEENPIDGETQPLDRNAVSHIAQLVLNVLQKRQECLADQNNHPNPTNSQSTIIKPYSECEESFFRVPKPASNLSECKSSAVALKNPECQSSQTILKNSKCQSSQNALKNSECQSSQTVLENSACSNRESLQNIICKLKNITSRLNDAHQEKPVSPNSSCSTLSYHSISHRDSLDNSKGMVSPQHIRPPEDKFDIQISPDWKSDSSTSSESNTSIEQYSDAQVEPIYDDMYLIESPTTVNKIKMQSANSICSGDKKQMYGMQTHNSIGTESQQSKDTGGNKTAMIKQDKENMLGRILKILEDKVQSANKQGSGEAGGKGTQKKQGRKIPETSPQSSSSQQIQEHQSKPVCNYVHYDHGMHWCRVCNVFPRTAKDYLNHLHSNEHRQETQKRSLADMSWHKNQPDQEVPKIEDAPNKRIPIRGLQFFISSTAWYCKLCDVWVGDLHCASLHLKSEKHADNYTKFTEQNPHWESIWLADREQAKRLLMEQEEAQPANVVSASSNTSSAETDTKEEKVKKKSKKLKNCITALDETEKKHHKKKSKKLSSSRKSSEEHRKTKDDENLKSICIAIRNKISDGKVSSHIKKNTHEDGEYKVEEHHLMISNVNDRVIRDQHQLKKLEDRLKRSADRDIEYMKMPDNRNFKWIKREHYESETPSYSSKHSCRESPSEYRHDHSKFDHYDHKSQKSSKHSLRHELSNSKIVQKLLVKSELEIPYIKEKTLTLSDIEDGEVVDDCGAESEFERQKATRLLKLKNLIKKIPKADQLMTVENKSIGESALESQYKLEFSVEAGKVKIKPKVPIGPQIPYFKQQMQKHSPLTMKPNYSLTEIPLPEDFKDASYSLSGKKSSNKRRMENYETARNKFKSSPLVQDYGGRFNGFTQEDPPEKLLRLVRDKSYKVNMPKKDVSVKKHVAVAEINSDELTMLGIDAEDMAVQKLHWA